MMTCGTEMNTYGFWPYSLKKIWTVFIFSCAVLCRGDEMQMSYHGFYPVALLNAKDFLFTTEFGF